MNWQHRLWLTVREFRKIRSNNDIKRDAIDSSKVQKEEIRLQDSRNYYVKKTSSNFRKSYQLSVAISKLQGLTNALRVNIHIYNTIKYLFTISKYLHNFHLAEMS